MGARSMRMVARAAYALLGVVVGVVAATWPTGYAQQPESTRWRVESQQLLDSGGKVVVIRDTKASGWGDRCYAIYEAGAGALIDRVACE